MPSTTILVADPRHEVRLFVKTALRGQDFHVIEARGGLQALCACACRPVDLLLIATDLPGIDGVQVAEKLSHPFPALRVLYLGAPPENQSAENVIAKPLDAEVLRTHIRRALEETTVRKSPANEPRSAGVPSRQSA